MSDDQWLLSRRSALKCMASGGAGNLFTLSGGVFTPIDQTIAASDKQGVAKRGKPLSVQISDTDADHRHRERHVRSARAHHPHGRLYIPSVAETKEATKIVVKDFMFNSTPLTVKSGSTVTWTNKDDEPHTVVGDTGMFRSGGMDTNNSFSYKFDKPGTYHFTCSIHPRMVGTVVAQ